MKKLLFCIAILGTTLLSFGQDKTKKLFTKENAFVGGNFTIPILQLLQGDNGGGGGNFMIGANPHFGYTLNKNVDVAAVLNIQSNKFDNTQANYTNLLNTGAITKVSMLGVGTFARLYILDFAFIHIQPELNRITKKETKYGFNSSTLQITQTQLAKVSELNTSFLIGAGYKRGFNQGRTFAYASVMYDIFTKNSPYSNAAVQTITGRPNSTPIFVRAGFNMSITDLLNRTNRR